MKNLVLLIVLSLTLLFTSCEKEKYEPLGDTNRTELLENGTLEEGILIYGEWKLLSGQMFVENLETGEKEVINHFASNSVSSLRYSGSVLDIETIQQNVTTWTFTESAEFWLNNDSAQPYGLQITNNYSSIIEHPLATASTMKLDGSARPYTVVVEDYTNQIVVFTIQEAYENINGYNCTYHSELRFQKQ